MGIIRNLWSDFFKNTSLHGCRNLDDADKKKPVRNLDDADKKKPVRFVWGLIVLGMLSGVIYFLSRSFIDYYEYNSKTVYRSESNLQLPFPAITVCNVGNYDTTRGNVSDAMRNTFIEYSSLKQTLPKDWRTTHRDDLLNLNVVDFHNNFSFIKKDFIMSATFNERNVLSRMEPVETLDGRCFQFNGQNSIGKYGRYFVNGEGYKFGLSLTLNVKQYAYLVKPGIIAGAMILIHEPHEVPRVFQEEKFMMPGTANFISLKKKMYKFLPYPYKSYGGGYCEDMPVNYSYDACVLRWISEQTINECKCRGPRDIDFTSFPGCTLTKTYECYLTNLTHYIYLVTTGKKLVHDCPRPCQFVNYDVQMSSAAYPSQPAIDLINKLHGTETDFIKNNYLKVTIYFKNFIEEYIEYEPAYSPMGMLGSIGGQMGLFLGASLVTLAEFFETIIYSFGILVRKYITHK